MKPREKLLIVDDDKSLVELLQDYLTQLGYEVFTAHDGKEGLRQFYAARPDLVLLDVTMPRQDGWQTLKILRDLSDVPIVMLTIRGDEADVLRGFSLGADDYITKPFSFAELGARIQAVLKRSVRGQTREGLLRAGDLVVDLTTKRVSRGRTLIPLTPTEFKLLVTLMQSPGRVFSPEEIVREVWGPQYAEEVGYVRRYIWHLRKKIEPQPDEPQYIHNERGFGYYFLYREHPEVEQEGEHVPFPPE